MIHKPNKKHQVHYHGEGLKSMILGIGLGAGLYWLFSTKEGQELKKKIFEEEGDVAAKLQEYFASKNVPMGKFFGEKEGTVETPSTVAQEESAPSMTVSESDFNFSEPTATLDEITQMEVADNWETNPYLKQAVEEVLSEQNSQKEVESQTPAVSEENNQAFNPYTLRSEVEEMPIKAEEKSVAEVEPETASKIVVVETSSPDYYNERSSSRNPYRVRRFFRRIR